MRRSLFLPMLLLGACTTPGGPYPSLQPRAAEAIDPRVPIERPMNDRPVTPALVAQLAALVSQAHNGDAAFDPAVAQAERLAAAAGERQSETWITAQEALSAAVSAREPTAHALGDIDGLAAAMLQAQRGIAPSDLDAIKSAAAEVGAIDRRQTERIDAVKQRLGI